MDLYGIGFSNIRFANDDTNYIHNYNYRINTFSEEVFMHEFIHTLERNSKEHGFETIDLHDYEKYGYDAGGINGLAEWYSDYMRCEILDERTNKYIGLNQNAYSLKPVNETNFKYVIEVKFNEEPSNIFEEIRCMFEVVTSAI
mgnify:CR=1 FL=1